ncbi:MAG: nitroreductase family protein [Ignavibacteriaceae bacterium]|jgi:nitroreductase
MGTKENKFAELSNVIRERHSIRHYDPDFKISDDEIKEIIKEAVYAPSGNNLQSWRFLIITDQKQKERIYTVSNDQEQVLEASALIIILGDLKGYEQVDLIYSRSVKEGIVTEEFKNAKVAKVKETFEKESSRYGNPNWKRDLVLIDGSLAAMQLMLAAKAKGYDSVPMIGYNTEKLRKILNIPDRYVNVLMIPIGKATEPAHPTLRLSVDEITFWNGID